MDKYKIKCYNPIDFEPYYVDTAISKELMDEIITFIENFKTTNLTLSPIIVNPSDMSIMIGVIEKENNRFTKRYQITIASV